MSLARRAFLTAAVAAAAASTIPRSLRAAARATFPDRGSVNRRFSLRYKGDTIGRHIVWSAPADEGARVSTEIEMTVKRFFLTVFSYSHRSMERWRDGRLMALDSETTEDGATFRVAGTAVSTGFRVIGKDGPFIAPATALTSNCLWNPAILQQEIVIDAQYGGVIGLSVRRLGDEQLLIAGHRVAAVRFTFITPDLAGTIWYDDAGRWVKGELEHHGARLEYRLDA